MQLINANNNPRWNTYIATVRYLLCSLEPGSYILQAPLSFRQNELCLYLHQLTINS
jgi:hypothetical protein